MDKSRQQFEEWRSKNKSSTLNLFDVWQASRESLEIELPERPYYEPFTYESGVDDGIEMCKQILISNGVKIKNE